MIQFSSQSHLLKPNQIKPKANLVEKLGYERMGSGRSQRSKFWIFVSGSSHCGHIPAHWNSWGHYPADSQDMLQYLFGQQKSHQSNHRQGYPDSDAERHFHPHGKPGGEWQQLPAAVGGAPSHAVKSSLCGLGAWWRVLASCNQSLLPLNSLHSAFALALKSTERISMGFEICIPDLLWVCWRNWISFFKFCPSVWIVFMQQAGFFFCSSSKRWILLDWIPFSLPFSCRRPENWKNQSIRNRSPLWSKLQQCPQSSIVWSRARHRANQRLLKRQIWAMASTPGVVLRQSQRTDMPPEREALRAQVRPLRRPFLQRPCHLHPGGCWRSGLASWQETSGSSSISGPPPWLPLCFSLTKHNPRGRVSQILLLVVSVFGFLFFCFGGGVVPRIYLTTAIWCQL